MTQTSYSKSDAFKKFKSWVATQRITVEGDKAWKYLDYGPKDIAPLICIPGSSGTTEVFFKQFITLCPRGFRLIAVQYPAYTKHGDFVKGFDAFLDAIHVQQAHIFGTALGGYLALCYAQYRPMRIASLVLSNTFADTSYFCERAPFAPMFTWMPLFMLQRIMLSNFPTGEAEVEIINSIDFMVEQLEQLSQDEISSRLTLNCSSNYIRPNLLKVENYKITIMDTMDDVAVPDKLREEVYKFFPEAKTAHLRSGGNFPYLSRAEDVNLYLQVHLRAHSVVPIVPIAVQPPPDAAWPSDKARALAEDEKEKKKIK